MSNSFGAKDSEKLISSLAMEFGIPGYDDLQLVWEVSLVCDRIGSSTQHGLNGKLNSLTTLTLGLAARSEDTDVIALSRTSLSHLRSYLSLARFTLNFYVSCGCWLICTRSSISISLGMKMASGVSVSGGVVLAHSAIIGMQLALLLHMLQP